MTHSYQMRTITTTIAWLTATLATTAARPHIAGDFDGDGIGDAAFYDAASASLEIGYGIAEIAPEWHTLDLRRHAYFDGRFLRAADLDADGRTDLYAAGHDANRVLVLWGDASRAPGFAVSEFAPGAGPAFADAAPGTLELAIPLLASQSPSWHRLLPSNPVAVPTVAVIDPAFAGADWTDFRAGREGQGIVFNAAALAAARAAGSEGVHVFQKRPLNPLSHASVKVPAALDRLTAFGFFEGAAAAPAVVAFGNGAGQVVILQVEAGAGADPPVLTDTVQAVAPIAEARTIATPAGDRLLLVAADGGAATIHSIAGGVLSLEQSIAAPAGEAFLSLVLGAGGDLIATLADGHGFAVYRDGGGGYVLHRAGLVPAPPAAGSGTQVVLFDRPLYGAAPALPLEGLPAGDWGSATTIVGSTISGNRENLGDPSAGLGNLTAFSLDARVLVPGTAAAVPNQLSQDSSIDFDGLPSADGAAAVLVAPPGGSYASTIELQFAAAPGAIVHFRLGDGGWQSVPATGTVTVSESARFEYYASAGKSLSAIRSHDYLITQDVDADSDGDRVPDAIERELGLSAFAGSDSDGDGHSDFSEIVAGTDPGDPADHPAEELKLDVVRLELDVLCPGADGVERSPVQGLELRVLSLDGGLIASGTSDSLTSPNAIFELASPPRFVVVETAEVFPLGGAFFQLWPHGRRLAALVEIPPLPILQGTVDPSSSDIVGDWLVGVNAGVALRQAASVAATLDSTSTLRALAAEAWLAGQLDLLGRIDPGLLPPQIIDDPVPGVRHLITEDDLDAIDTAATGRHDITAALAKINSIPIPDPLIETARGFYSTSASIAPSDTSPPAPIAALRELFGLGTVPSEYVPALADDPVVLGALWNGVVTSPDAAELVDTSGILSTSGTECLVLTDDMAPGTRYELVDSSGAPYWQTTNSPVIDGAMANLVGYIVPGAIAACGDVVVEVISLQVTGIPDEIVEDTDGDMLPDEVETLLLGGLEGGFWSDPDGDGYATGEELFLQPGSPSDPSDPEAFPAVPPAFPAAIESVATDGKIFLEWDGNPAATYTVDCAIGLDGDWVPSPIPPTETLPGHFEWQDPNPLSDETRKFYRISVVLSP